MTIEAPAGARVIFERPELLTDRSTHYCPGCGHGVVNRLIAEVLGEMGLGSRTIAVAPVGCAVFVYDYIGVDFVEAPHGRAPAVATGIRRVRPDAFVLTYQGDGDLAAIGTAEIIHAAGRGELLTAVCQRAPEPKRLIWIASADHFFQGTTESPGAKLSRMQAEMRLWLRETFALVGTANQPDLRI